MNTNNFTHSNKYIELQTLVESTEFMKKVSKLADLCCQLSRNLERISMLHRISTCIWTYACMTHCIVSWQGSSQGSGRMLNPWFSSGISLTPWCLLLITIFKSAYNVGNFKSNSWYENATNYSFDLVMKI